MGAERKEEEIMSREKKKSSNRRVSESSNRHDCLLCKEYFIPNEVTRKAIGETGGSLTFADAKSAFAFLMEEC